MRAFKYNARKIIYNKMLLNEKTIGGPLRKLWQKELFSNVYGNFPVSI